MTDHDRFPEKHPAEPMTSHSPRGSLWHRWDLHFHTPSSFDYDDKSVTDQQIVDRLVQENVRVVAITDHHVMDVPRIQRLQSLGAGTLTVLPAIELRDDHGKEPIHYICIFPENCDLNHVWTTLQSGRKPVGRAQDVPDRRHLNWGIVGSCWVCCQVRSCTRHEFSARH